MGADSQQVVPSPREEGGGGGPSARRLHVFIKVSLLQQAFLMFSIDTGYEQGAVYDEGHSGNLCDQVGRVFVNIALPAIARLAARAGGSDP